MFTRELNSKFQSRFLVVIPFCRFFQGRKKISVGIFDVLQNTSVFRFSFRLILHLFIWFFFVFSLFLFSCIYLLGFAFVTGFIPFIACLNKALRLGIKTGIVSEEFQRNQELVFWSGTYATRVG
jgi:hypothetical protein